MFSLAVTFVFSLRLWVSIVAGLLTVGFFYRWGLQVTSADWYFPGIGRCTALECRLAYLNVFVVAAAATWYAGKKEFEDLGCKK